MATSTKTRRKTTSSGGGRGPGGMRTRIHEDRAKRVAAKNKVRAEKARAAKLRQEARERRKQRVADAQAVAGAFGRSCKAGWDFLAPKVATTGKRAGRATYRGAQRAGWAPDVDRHLQRARRWREDVQTNGWRRQDWAEDMTTGQHVHQDDVGEHLGEPWREPVGAPPPDMPNRKERRRERKERHARGEGPAVVSLFSWWRPHRRQAAAFTAEVDAAIRERNRRAVTPDLPPAVPAGAPRLALASHGVDDPTPGPSGAIPLPGGRPGGVVLPFRPRRALNPSQKETPVARGSAPAGITLQSLEELLDPEWSQASFQEDVPEWLDKIAAVKERIAELEGELAELGAAVKLPDKTAGQLGDMAEHSAEGVGLAKTASKELRELYESYEIPDLPA